MKIRGLIRMFLFTGWRLSEVTFSPEAVQVQLVRDRRRRLRCPRCGRKVVGTHGSSMLDNREAIEAVAAGVIDVEKLITHRVGLHSLPEELDSAGSAGRLKVVVLPNR